MWNAVDDLALLVGSVVVYLGLTFLVWLLGGEEEG